MSEMRRFCGWRLNTSGDSSSHRLNSSQRVTFQVPVVPAQAFLTWQLLETMAKRERESVRGRHSSAVTLTPPLESRCSVAVAQLTVTHWALPRPLAPRWLQAGKSPHWPSPELSTPHSLHTFLFCPSLASVAQADPRTAAMGLSSA